MAKESRPKLTSNFFATIADEVRLVLRLMADRRVNPLLKLLPIGTVLYFIIPDLFLGPIDDALILGVGTYLFIELCPPEVVKEHREALRGVVDSNLRDVDNDQIPIHDEDIIEGEFWDE